MACVLGRIEVEPVAAVGLHARVDESSYHRLQACYKQDKLLPSYLLLYTVIIFT
jgi:hypothetical protein